MGSPGTGDHSALGEKTCTLSRGASFKQFYNDTTKFTSKTPDSGDLSANTKHKVPAAERNAKDFAFTSLASVLSRQTMWRRRHEISRAFSDRCARDLGLLIMSKSRSIECAGWEYFAPAWTQLPRWRSNDCTLTSTVSRLPRTAAANLRN